MLARCLICDRWGLPLAEASPSVSWLRWRLNYTGQAEFSLAYADPACRSDVLALGHRVAFIFDSGLPLWGGVLDTPRSRDGERVYLTAYTGEALLDWRISGQSVVLEDLRPGPMAAAMLAAANADHVTGVGLGDIEEDGDELSLTLHYHDLLDRLRYIARLSGQDFNVRPLFTGSRLGFWLDWYVSRGADLSGDVCLVEGANVTAATVREAGMIANRVVVVGDGVGWGPDRIIGIAEDQASIARYGLREWAELHTDIQTAATAAASAAVLLGKMRVPEQRVTLQDVLNEAPGLFSSYGVGDTVTVQAFEDRAGWSYREDLRVMSRTWYGDRDVCDLELGAAEWEPGAEPITDLARATSLAIDAGDAAATEAAWLLVKVGTTEGYVRVYGAP